MLTAITTKISTPPLMVAPTLSLFSLFLCSSCYAFKLRTKSLSLFCIFDPTRSWELGLFSIPKLFLRDPKAERQKLMSWFPSIVLRCQHRRGQEACEVLLTGGDNERRRSAAEMPS
ncbi:hypothetical protein AAHE18_18G071700 [Arachis hypogaea]